MAKQKGKKTAPYKAQKTEYLEVSPDEPWLHTYIGKGFYDADFQRIIDFYVLHSPCKISSYTPHTIESFGWRNVWQSSTFRKTFDAVPGFVENDTFRWHESKNHFLEMWSDADWGDFFEIENKEFAVIIKAGETSQRMDLFHHIRNAFAHGRFAVKKVNKEYYIYFEDVTNISGYSGLFVNARMCLKKSTLIEWLNIFEKKSEAVKNLKSLFADVKSQKPDCNV